MHIRVLSPVAALALSAIAGAALAQSSLPNGASSLLETYGNWQVACQLLPPNEAPDATGQAGQSAGKSTDKSTGQSAGQSTGKSDRPVGRMTCALAQVQREEKSRLLVFSGELQVPDAKSDDVAANFVLPFGIAVVEPIAIKVDDKELKPLSVATCLPVGCIVPASPLQAEAIAALTAGKPLTIATRDTNGRAVAFELKPEGFPEGLKRLRALEAGAK